MLAMPASTAVRAHTDALDTTGPQGAPGVRDRQACDQSAPSGG